MNSDTLPLATTVGCLCAIAQSHTRFQKLALQLQAKVGIVDVIHWSRMYKLTPGCRFEETIGASLVGGQGIDWYLEITANDGLLHVEADIRLFHDQEQDVIRAVADEDFFSGDAFIVSLARIVEDMCDLSRLPEIS